MRPGGWFTASLGRLKTSRLAREASEQALANAAAQALGAITTLSFVHLLPVADYALFGLCMTTLSFISVASDLGLMSSLHYFWRASGRDLPLLLDRYAAIRRIRSTLFFATGSVAVLILGWLNWRTGAGAGSVVALMLLVLGIAWAQIGAHLIVVPLRLSGHLRRAYLVELAGSALRALLAALAFLFALQRVWFPLASVGIAALAVLALARLNLGREYRSLPRPSRGALVEVGKYIVPTIPGTLVFATQDLFVYWIASLAGGSTVVAQTFALGRLAAIFAMLNGVMSNVVVPRIVRSSDDGHAFRNGIIPIACMAAFCAALTLLVALFPSVPLLLLGGNYHGLEIELVISMASASFAFIGLMFGQLSRTMGWVRWEAPMLVIHVALALAAIPLFDFTTTQGVLGYGMTLAFINMLKMGAILIIGRRASRAGRAV